MAGAGYKLFATGDVLTAAQVNTYLMQQTTMVFASSAARTSALSGVVSEGMLTYLLDTNSLEYYDGAAFQPVSNPGDITGVTAGTGLTGGGTSGSVTLAIDSTVATLTGSQTLTNKTLTTPIIATISNTGTLTLPTSTDTMVGRATTDTLTNKTLTSPVLTTPSISNIDAKGDLLAGTADNTIGRLAVGTNGQVLQADSTAPTGLAWATAGGGNFIKIAANTFSAQSSVAIDSVFSATYRNYVVILNAFAVTDTDDFQLQFRYAGSTQTSTYYGAYTMINRSNTVTTAGYTSASQALLATSMETSANGGSSANLTFTNVGISGKPRFYGNGSLSDGPAIIDLACFQDTARTYDGILIKSSSSNITGNYAVYGVSD